MHTLTFTLTLSVAWSKLRTMSWLLESNEFSDFRGDTIICGLEVCGTSSGAGVTDLELFFDDRSWGFSLIASSEIKENHKCNFDH